jgi:peptidyl-prolyl cis-trans isomerase D
MLAQFRTIAKHPIVTVAMALLAFGFSFGLWGMRDMFTGPGGVGDTVIRAGSRKVDATHFRRTVENYLQQLGQQTGQPVSMQDVVAHGLERQLADGIAADEASAAYVDRLGIRPSDALVGKSLQQFTAFFNPVSGAFDAATYRRLLAQNNMTPQEFEKGLRGEIAESQFASGLAGGLRAPAIYAAIPAIVNGEGRTFSWFTIGPKAVGAVPPPTDAQLTALMNQFADRLRRPEMRVLTVTHVSAAQLAPTLPADPAAVQKRYDAEKDTLNQPEKRTIVEIPVRDAKAGAAAAARLQKGEDPAAVAKSFGVQPVVYPDTAKASVADRKVADAAFSMTAGQARGPVQGDLGVAAIKVLKVTPAHTVTLEQARPQLEAEVRKAEADDKIRSVMQKFEDTHSGGANLADAAKAAGLPVTTLPPVTAKGTDLQGHPLPLPPKVLQTAFGLQQGADSDLQDAGNGEYYAVRVEKVQPPALPALAEIRPILTQVWTMQQLQERLRTKAEQLADSVRKGQSLQAAAASVGSTVQHAVDVRPAAAAQQLFSQELLGRLFAAHKPGEVVFAPDKAGADVAQLQATVPASAMEIAQGIQAQRQQASSSLLNDLGSTVRKAAVAVIKPKIDYKRARAALGAGAPGSPAQ